MVSTSSSATAQLLIAKLHACLQLGDAPSCAAALQDLHACSQRCVLARLHQLCKLQSTDLSLVRLESSIARGITSEQQRRQCAVQVHGRTAIGV
jgi:hypothetical protein